MEHEASFTGDVGRLKPLDSLRKHTNIVIWDVRYKVSGGRKGIWEILKIRTELELLKAIRKKRGRERMNDLAKARKQS